MDQKGDREATVNFVLPADSLVILLETALPNAPNRMHVS